MFAPILARRLRILSTERNTRTWAALVVQYQWRKFNDALARANDPIYEMINNDKQALSSGKRWAARALHRSSTRTAVPVGKRGTRRGGGGGGSGGEGVQRAAAAARSREQHDDSAAGMYVMMSSLDEIKEMMIDLKARVERIEEATPRTKASRKSLGGITTLGKVRDASPESVAA